VSPCVSCEYKRSQRVRRRSGASAETSRTLTRALASKSIVQDVLEYSATEFGRGGVLDLVRIEFGEEIRDVGGLLFGDPVQEGVPESCRMFVAQLVDFRHGLVLDRKIG
jgi:hypothetical protein